MSEEVVEKISSDEDDDIGSVHEVDEAKESGDEADIGSVHEVDEAKESGDEADIGSVHEVDEAKESGDEAERPSPIEEKNLKEEDLKVSDDNGDEIDLDYGEDTVRDANENCSAGHKSTTPEEGELSDDGEITSSEDGEIRDDGEASVESTRVKPDREEGELEDGEIDDSDDDAPATKGSKQSDNRGRSPRFPVRTGPPPPVRRQQTLVVPAPSSDKPETAWERGLREARELMKKANQKKTDPDFEQKRLHLAPSDEKDWKHDTIDSDDERVAPNRLPSLLDLSCEPPNRNRKKERYRGYELPSDLGPQCIYPNGRPERKRKMMPLQGRNAPVREMRNVRSRSPPPRPEAISSSPSPTRSGSRSPPRKALDQRDGASRKVMGGLEDRPHDPWARGRRMEPIQHHSSVSSRSVSRSGSRSRSTSSVRSRGRGGAPRSPPTGDITFYRIPKKKGGMPLPRRMDTQRRTPPQREDRRMLPRNRDDRMRPFLRGPQNGMHDRNMRRPQKDFSDRRQAAVVRDHPVRTPPPVDLEPRGAEAISDDENTAVSGSSRSSSASSRSSSKSSASSSSSSRSSSRSSSSSAASSHSRSTSPALPAKYRMSNVEPVETEHDRPKEKKSKNVVKPRSPSPVSADETPPRATMSTTKRGRPRTPSNSPPPPPPREEKPPPPPPAPPVGERERDDEKPKNQQRLAAGKEQRPRKRDAANIGGSGTGRQQSKEELLAELREVEQQLMKKRRQVAS